MTIRHLEVFIAVVDCGTMRAAAEKLFISQPTISQAIKELEEEYDVKLFERLNKRIYITDSGRKLLSYARHIVSSVQECENALKSEKEHPVIYVGASVSVGTAKLPDYIGTYENSGGAADVRVTVNNTSFIEKQVLTNALDFAIVEGNIESDEIVSKVVGRDELFMVVGKSHPFYKHPKISVESLEGQNIISREDGSVDRNQFEMFLREQNIHMNKKWTCTNVQAIKNAVISGQGIGILSSLLIDRELESKELKILNIDDVHMRRNIKLIYHKNKYLTEAMQEFIECL